MQTKIPVAAIHAARFRAACTGAALLAATVGCGRSDDAAPQDPAASGTATGLDRVVAGPVERRPLALTTTQPGRIEAYEEAPLHARVAGYVERVPVDLGDPVSHEDVLVLLSVPELQNDVERQVAQQAQSVAAVDQAEAALAAAQATAESVAVQVAHAEAGIVRREGEYERWRAEHERMERLAAGDSVTKKLVDETRSQLRAAEAGRLEGAALVRVAKAATTAAEANVRKARADLVAAEAQVRVADAEVAHARTMRSFADIRAPFDGIVVRRQVDPGHFVQAASGPAARPLLTVARTDRVRIFVDVPELEAALVDVGDPATVRIQALGGATVEAAVARTSWALDPSNRSLRTVIDLPNEDGRLRPGMFASASILLERKSDALVVPATAIVRDGGKTYVCVVDGSGRIDRREVSLGLRSGNDIEILAGLEPGQAIVLARADALRHGQSVEIVKPKQP